MNYPEDFEKLWKCFGVTEKRGLGARGVKYEAYQEWQKLELPPVDELIGALANQANKKIQCRIHHQPWTYFKHACRWLKYRCWEGDEDLDNLPETFGESEILKRIADRSWASD